MSMEDYRPWRGQDDFGGYVYSCIVQDLAQLAVSVSLTQMQKALEEAEFNLDHLPKEDGGPDWESDIFKEVVESATGNCLDVSWLYVSSFLAKTLA
jgi:hypothetical protein